MILKINDIYVTSDIFGPQWNPILKIILFYIDTYTGLLVPELRILSMQKFEIKVQYLRSLQKYIVLLYKKFDNLYVHQKVITTLSGKVIINFKQANASALKHIVRKKPNVFSLSVARLFCCYLHLDSIRNLPAMASNVATKTTKSAESFLTSEDLYYWLTTWPTVSAQLKLVVIGLRRRQVSCQTRTILIFLRTNKVIRKLTINIISISFNIS